MSVDPLPISNIHRMLNRPGALDAPRRAELGSGLLIGALPEEAAERWSFKTRLNLVPNTPALEAAGLSMDMLCWPLRRRGLASLMGSAIRIGRAPSNDVVINHGQVSKLHARVQVEGADLLLVDAGSVNGTFLNGVKVDALPARLRAGDVVHLGSVTLTYYPVSRLLELLLARPQAGAVS